MPISVRVGSTWREVQEIYCRVSGTWREVVEGYVRVSGTWRLVHNAIPPTGSGWLTTETTGGSIGWNNTQISRYNNLLAYNKSCQVGHVQVRRSSAGGGAWAYHANTNEWVQMGGITTQVDTHHFRAPDSLNSVAGTPRSIVVIRPEEPLVTSGINRAGMVDTHTGVMSWFGNIHNHTSPMTDLGFNPRAVAGDNGSDLTVIIRWTNIAQNTLAIYKHIVVHANNTRVETVHTVNAWESNIGLWSVALAACRQPCCVVRAHSNGANVYVITICGSSGQNTPYSHGVIIRLNVTPSSHFFAIWELNSTHFVTTSFTPNNLRDFSIGGGRVTARDGVSIRPNAMPNASSLGGVSGHLVLGTTLSGNNLSDYITSHQMGLTYAPGNYPVIYNV